MQEKWKPVLGFEGIYAVSNRGRVRRELTRTRAKAGHFMKLTVNKDGYASVGLSNREQPRCCRVHRLVWEAFRDQIPSDRVVNHRDGDKINNHLENLELLTRSENILHAFRELGRRRPGEKLTTMDAVTIRKARANGSSLKELAIVFDVTEACISSVVLGRTWKHAGGPIAEPRPMRESAPAVAKRITDEQVTEAMRRYKAGDGTAALAREYDVSKRTILNWAQGRTRI